MNLAPCDRCLCMTCARIIDCPMHEADENRCTSVCTKSGRGCKPGVPRRKAGLYPLEAPIVLHRISPITHLRTEDHLDEVGPSICPGYVRDGPPKSPQA